VSSLQLLLSLASGFMVGFSLGLIGGGGSILAIPLLIYFVGFDHPHLAIGTTALAVGVNSYFNLVPHARKGHVDLKVGVLFTVPGVIGVLVGSELGLLTPGTKLLFIFAILMIVIAAYMLKRKCIDTSIDPPRKDLDIKKLTGIGALVGFASGYFGIGGGFLIVPGLIFSAGFNIIQAVGTSLFAVGTFGIVTAARYAISGDLNLIISILFIIGGIVGGWAGAHFSSKMPKRTLTRVFAVIIIVVAIYMLYMNASAFL